jgi:Fe-S oxidoreductase
MNEKDLIAKYRIEDCTRCKNECAAACPVFRHYGRHHPQELAHLFLRGGDGAARDHRLLWTCVTCRACTEACPFKVEFADFIRELRVGRSDFRPVYGGLVRAYQLKQATGPKPGAAKARISWVDKSLELGSESGVAPSILEDERCCGRDLYDTGGREAFEALARHNAAEIAKTKAHTVLTVCPECAYTLKVTYARELGGQPFEVRHITEYVAELIGKLAFDAGEETFAFHDPCYLCRYLGIEDAPRALLEALSSKKPVELERRGTSAPCCGAGSLVDHGPHTRTAVDERLVEAHRAGAGTLVTACPKCTLTYAEVLGGTSWRRAPVDVRDLLTLAAARLSK